jgi:sarcosine oxidase subunit gamma
MERRAPGGMATVMARKGSCANRIGAALGLKAPVSPTRSLADDGLSLIGYGTGAWLAMRENAAAFWADDLRARLDGLASVSDQSGAYVIHRLTGLGARTLLQRGLAIDLHPDVFGPNGAATSVIAHIGVVLWIVDNRPSYDVAVQRSYAESFRHWLEESATAL